MTVVSVSEMHKHFGLMDQQGGNTGLVDVLKELQGLKATVVAGAAAGNVTVTGIAADDTLIAVLHLDMGGNAETDLTSEFSITAANTINNTGGTATTNDTLLVLYFDKSGASTGSYPS